MLLLKDDEAFGQLLDTIEGIKESRIGDIYTGGIIKGGLAF